MRKTPKLLLVLGLVTFVLLGLFTGCPAEVVNKAALNDAIEAAETNLDSVEQSTDGEDQYTDVKWVTSAAYNAYDAAIDAAQAVADNDKATQEEVDAAVTALATATTTFNGAKKDGLKPFYKLTFEAKEGEEDLEGATIAVFSDAEREVAVEDLGRLDPGTYYYTVEKFGFKTLKAEVEIGNADVAVEIELEELDLVSSARLAPHADRGGGVLPYAALYNLAGDESTVAGATINDSFVVVGDGEITITYDFTEIEDHKDEGTDPVAPREDKWLGTYFAAPTGAVSANSYVDGGAKSPREFAKDDDDFEAEFGAGFFRWFAAQEAGYEHVVVIEWLDGEGDIVKVEKATVKYVHEAGKVYPPAGNNGNDDNGSGNGDS